MNLEMRMYNEKIREVEHFNGYIIINQTNWYKESEFTEEEAKAHFLNRRDK